MSDLQIVLPPPGRINATLLHDLHPQDHDAIVDAVNQVAAAQEAGLTAVGQYRVYETIANRNSDIPFDGLLAWANTEGVMAIRDGGVWKTLFEPLIDFTPRLWVGTGEFANVTPVVTPAYRSCYRHEFGMCRFWIAARFGSLGAGATGTLAVMCPLPPAIYEVTIVSEPDPGVPEIVTGDVSSGTFGMAYAVTGDHGAIGGIGGVYDGTVTLSGASSAGELAIVMPGGGGLMDDTDMGGGTSSITGGSPGEFDVYLAGLYQTSEF